MIETKECPGCSAERLCHVTASKTITKLTTSKIAKALSTVLLPCSLSLDVAVAKGRIELMAPGSCRFRPQVAQSHATGSTSQPHSAQ